MALYKSLSGQPQLSQCIDGQVWSAAGVGSTIRGWVYPTMHPSAQFGRFNDLVRAAGQAWAEMSSADQAVWSAHVMPWPPPGWWLWCWVKPIYGPMPWSGEEFYAHTCAWAAMQGLPAPTVPPGPTVVPDGDTFSLGCWP